MENTLTGLSSLHISTQGTVIEPAKVIYYSRGSLATVNRTMVEKVCLVCGEIFKVAQWDSHRKNTCQACKSRTVSCAGCGERVRVVPVVVGEKVNKKTGEVKKVRDPDPSTCPYCEMPLELGNRGEVFRFSEDSRRRLMRMLATIDSETRPHMVTLTFPDSYVGYKDPDDWKRILNVFVMRFEREFTDGSFIWRLETINRKSGVHIGEVFPHFHLLVFGVEFNRLRMWVSKAWYETVGTGDIHHLNAGTQVARILSRRGVFRYASKTVGETMSREMGKAVQALGKVGRWWGIVVRDNFNRFISPVEELALEESESVQVIRYFRRLANGFGRAYSRLTTFISGAWLLKNIVRMVAPGGGKNSFRATGRLYDVPFLQHALKVGWLVPQLE